MKMSARLLRRIIDRNASDAFHEWVKRRAKVVYFTARRETPRVLSEVPAVPESALLKLVRQVGGVPGYPQPARLVLREPAPGQCPFAPRKGR